jgi:hypothetical protein
MVEKQEPSLALVAFYMSFLAIVLRQSLHSENWTGTVLVLVLVLVLILALVLVLMIVPRTRQDQTISVRHILHSSQDESIFLGGLFMVGVEVRVKVKASARRKCYRNGYG